jgi:hypothetical protein
VGSFPIQLPRPSPDTVAVETETAIITFNGSLTTMQFKLGSILSYAQTIEIVRYDEEVVWFVCSNCHANPLCEGEHLSGIFKRNFSSHSIPSRKNRTDVGCAAGNITFGFHAPWLVSYEFHRFSAVNFLF